MSCHHNPITCLVMLMHAQVTGKAPGRSKAWGAQARRAGGTGSWPAQSRAWRAPGSAARAARARSPPRRRPCGARCCLGCSTRCRRPAACAGQHSVRVLKALGCRGLPYPKSLIPYSRMLFSRGTVEGLQGAPQHMRQSSRCRAPSSLSRNQGGRSWERTSWRPQRLAGPARRQWRAGGRAARVLPRPWLQPPPAAAAAHVHQDSVVYLLEEEQASLAGGAGPDSHKCTH